MEVGRINWKKTAADARNKNARLTRELAEARAETEAAGHAVEVLAAQVERLQAEADAMRAVVDAAWEWRRSLVEVSAEEAHELAAAVDALHGVKS